MPDDFMVQVSYPDSGSHQETELSSVWQQFSTAFQELLKPDNPAAVSLGAFLRRTLGVFRLLGFHSELEVLAEVYIRAHRLIHSECAEIRNPAAWVRKTAHNVIREWSRGARRYDSLDQEVIDCTDENLKQQLTLEADVKILNRAWQSLTDEEQRLLSFKIVQNFSWNKIATIYAAEGKYISEPTLRQQKARALKHLRRLYHTLRPLTDIKDAE